MAYSQDQINAAYAAERARGATDADLQRIGAEQFGVTADQFNLAKMAYSPASSPAASPAASPMATAPGASDRFSQAQYDGARAWANGKSAKEILGESARLGLTAQEVGRVFGDHGGSAQQVMDATGYATAYRGAGVYDYVPWSTAKEKDLDGWRYDINSQTGWVKDAKRIPDPKPSTGINLSQLQGPINWSVTPDQTVQKQLEQIIAADSPLMQQARTQALQQANARGLLNSSMAVTAGQSAVLEAATPIAQQDASTYARAGEFNANSANTFARDNNAFVRDAFMADFNLGANEWAAQQEFERQYKTLDRQQQLLLERDAVQNGFQSARDRYLNDWNVAAADKEADLRLQLARMDAASRPAQQADTSLERLRMQINANQREQGLSTLNNARSNFASQMITIATSGLSGDAKDKAISDLTMSTNAIIRSTAQQMGWSADSWMIRTESAAAAPAPAPVPAPEQSSGAGA